MFFWLAPLVLHSSDAHAWGLYTHMYFAQLLVWAVPLADPRFRRALRRFPDLCLAGACLPDISLFSGFKGLAGLRATHRWSSALRMLNAAADDRERAIAVGFAGHLLTDTVAHNHFVPTHENIWFSAGAVTHAASEWAMDAHLAPHVFVEPARLIEEHGDELADAACSAVGCERKAAARGLNYLTRGERALRASRAPQAIYLVSRRAERGTLERFDDYVRVTAARMRGIDALVAGTAPVWRPEIASTRRARRRVAEAGMNPFGA